MSEKIRILYYALWVAHPVLQTAIAIAMFRRGQHRAFKFFFAYIVTQIMTFAVVFPTYRYNYSACFLCFLDQHRDQRGFGFHGDSRSLSRCLPSLPHLARPGHRVVQVGRSGDALVAGVVSVSTSSSDNAPWVQAITTAQRCVRIIQVGMVLFLLFFARYLGVSRRQHSFGIALGFGTFAVVELAS